MSDSKKDFLHNDYLKRWKKCGIALEGMTFFESEIIEVGDDYIVFTTPKNCTIIASYQIIKYVTFIEEKKNTWWQSFWRERALKRLLGEDW